MNDASTKLIPEGLWVMNPARSQRLVPGTHSLWIVKNDGRALIFASVETDAAGTVKLTSWDGVYDGGPTEVVGSGMMASITAPAAGEMLITGTIPDMGDFSERCVLSADGMRLVCTGKIATADGPITYCDDFDFHGAMPGAFT